MNRRIFDVLVEGSIVLDDFDIFREAPGKNIPKVVTTNAFVTDGTITIDFVNVMGDPTINGIEIIHTGGSVAPSAPTVSAPTTIPTKIPTKTPTKSPTNIPTNTPLATAPVGQWIEVLPNSTLSARHEACFVMVGRKAYLLAGRDKKPVNIYDPVTRTWTNGTVPPIQIHHTQCVAYGDAIYIVSSWTGGYPMERNVDKIYVRSLSMLDERYHVTSIQ